MLRPRLTGLFKRDFECPEKALVPKKLPKIKQRWKHPACSISIFQKKMFVKNIYHHRECVWCSALALPHQHRHQHRHQHHVSSHIWLKLVGGWLWQCALKMQFHSAPRLPIKPPMLRTATTRVCAVVARLEIVVKSLHEKDLKFYVLLIWLGS